MKIIGKTSVEVDKYLFDYCSILHFIFGIFGYVIYYTLFTSFIVSTLLVVLSSVFWELIENTILVDMKVNNRRDDVINSQGDTLSVFIGSLIGGLIYPISLIVVLFTMGALLVFYIIAMIFTRKKICRH